MEKVKGKRITRDSNVYICRLSAGRSCASGEGCYLVQIVLCPNMPVAGSLRAPEASAHLTSEASLRQEHRYPHRTGGERETHRLSHGLTVPWSLSSVRIRTQHGWLSGWHSLHTTRHCGMWSEGCLWDAWVGPPALPPIQGHPQGRGEVGRSQQEGAHPRASAQGGWGYRLCRRVVKEGLCLVSGFGG